MYGTGYATNVAYVPEWHQGVSPYGSWAVQSITVAAGWKQSRNRNLDFAFLAVTPPPATGRPIQSVTGGLRLGAGTGYAHPVTVIGYNNTDDQPIGCATTSFEFETGQMEFYCNSFWNGTSGGPWILHLNPMTGSGTVVGDIGGYEQGGDYPWASYSPYDSLAESCGCSSRPSCSEPDSVRRWDTPARSVRRAPSSRLPGHRDTARSVRRPRSAAQ